MTKREMRRLSQEELAAIACGPQRTVAEASDKIRAEQVVRERIENPWRWKKAYRRETGWEHRLYDVAPPNLTLGANPKYDAYDDPTWDRYDPFDDPFDCMEWGHQPRYGRVVCLGERHWRASTWHRLGGGSSSYPTLDEAKAHVIATLARCDALERERERERAEA